MSALSDREHEARRPALRALPDLPKPLPAGTLIAGRYRIDEVLGRGGMATVYRGHDERLRRDVAVKVCHARQDLPAPPLQEEHVSSRLIHNNIVSIFDAGHVPDGEPAAGSAFIVMEYVKGTTAHDIAPVSWRQAIDIVSQAAVGLSAAHALGFVHCDVTPSNVLIDESGRVLLADFGVAVEANSAADDIVHGSPSYIAPERIEGANADARVDVYGLGGVLAYLLTARHPHPDEPVAFPPNCPQAVRDIVVTARARRPDERYANARELEEALSDAPSLITSGDGRYVHVTADAVTQHVPVQPEPAPTVWKPVHRLPDAGDALASDGDIVEEQPEPGAATGVPARWWRSGQARTRAIAALLALVVLVGLVAVEAMSTDSAPVTSGPPGIATVVEMPAVDGMQFADAIEQLAQQGITVTRVDVIYGPGPLNQVVAQEPASGQVLEAGQDVTLVVRTGR